MAHCISSSMLPPEVNIRSLGSWGCLICVSGSVFSPPSLSVEGGSIKRRFIPVGRRMQYVRKGRHTEVILPSPKYKFAIRCRFRVSSRVDQPGLLDLVLIDEDALHPLVRDLSPKTRVNVSSISTLTSMLILTSRTLKGVTYSSLDGGSPPW